MRINSGDNLTPLTPQTAGILLALAQKPLYGYAIMQQSQVDSQYRVNLSAGSLYPTLQRLKASRLIEELGLEENTSSPYKRKLFQLTDTGRELLRLEMERQADFVALARHRLAKKS